MHESQSSGTRWVWGTLAAAGVLVLLALVPSSSSAAVCADYSNQAAAQNAKDTRDADSDGIYCESLPCPCSKPGGSSTPSTPSTPAPKPKASCTRTGRTEPISFSRRKYPKIYAHFRSAIGKGWPRTLVLNRPGADARRGKLLRQPDALPTKTGYDRDEYPPAVGRGKGFHVLGFEPRGWKADVAYVGSHENRSHGALLGARLRPFCNGQRFKYDWK